MMSYLKKPENLEIRNFITENKNRFIFPYSDAHFSDLMKSYSTENIYFMEDLNTLEWLCDKTYLGVDKGVARCYIYSPIDYFRDNPKEENNLDYFNMDEIFKYISEGGAEIGLSEIGEQLKTLLKSTPASLDINESNREQFQNMFPGMDESSTHWDLLKASGNMLKQMSGDKEFYKDLRKMITKNGISLGQNSGNWKAEEVIDNIDGYLKFYEPGLDFFGYMDKIFELRNEEPDEMTYFMGCYNMLDLIGYKQDKLPKVTDTPMNIHIDAQHAYLAGNCDIFVVADKNLALKSKVLYNKSQIETKVFSPSEFIEEITKIIHWSIPKANEGNFLNEAIELINQGFEKREFPEHSKDGGFAYSRKLRSLYFDFFNYASVQEFATEDKIEITFYKRLHNFSKFFYFSEVEAIIKKIALFFGWEINAEVLEKTIKDGKDVDVRINYEFGYVQLGLEEYSGLKRPFLIYGIKKH